MRIGDALDTLHTSPEDFQTKFTTSVLSRPGGYMGKFIDKLSLNLDLDNIDPAQFEHAYTSSGFSIPLNSVIGKFMKSPTLLEYYKARQEAKGRKILSAEEFDTVMSCKRKLLENAFTSRYFVPSRNTQLFFQVAIYFTYRGVEMKAMLDGILVNHETKEIQPFDLKTTGKGS